MDAWVKLVLFPHVHLVKPVADVHMVSVGTRALKETIGKFSGVKGVLEHVCHVHLLFLEMKAFPKFAMPVKIYFYQLSVYK